jgi:hypothetical protein
LQNVRLYSSSLNRPTNQRYKVLKDIQACYQRFLDFQSEQLTRHVLRNFIRILYFKVFVTVFLPEKLISLSDKLDENEE